MCTVGPSLGAKSGLDDDFSQKMFPITPPGNGNVGMGFETFENSVLKSTKNRRRRRKSQAKFRQKTKTAFWEHEYFLYFLLFK